MLQIVVLSAITEHSEENKAAEWNVTFLIRLLGAGGGQGSLS